MKITHSEINELEQFLDLLDRDGETRYVYPKDHPDAGEVVPWWFFAEHPHLLMPMGFDEYVAFDNKKQFAKSWFAGNVEDTGQSLYRQPNGQWLLLFGGPLGHGSDLSFHSRTTIDFDDEYALRIATDELLRKLYEIADKWTVEQKTIWHPTLWTPEAQQKEKSLLHFSVSKILKAIHDEKKELADLSWRQLEELVAEVLRIQGLEIHVVRESPQGGRDILARGELIPGQEPVTMAVEVKHKAVVDRPEIQTALWQNRHFPALLFVTSGRFTSGVFEEKSLPENQLRLFLKDGAALGDLIHGSLSSPLSPKVHNKSVNRSGGRRVSKKSR